MDDRILLYGATGFKENFRPGFQTPFRLFGAKILDEIAGFTLKLKNDT